MGFSNVNIFQGFGIFPLIVEEYATIVKDNS